MFIVEAEVRSESASRYLVQMCKHFAHKVKADYDETHGRVDFRLGLCVMNAIGDRLNLRCEAPNEPDLITVKDIVTAHLVRFAWKEELAVNWSAQQTQEIANVSA